MNRNAEILKELQELNSSLAEMPWRTLYAIPDNYFTSLASDLAAGTFVADTAGDAVPALPKVLPLAIPEGYLSQLPDTLLAAVKEQSIPHRRRAKRIGLRVHWRRASRLTAAAVLVLGLGFGGYQYLHPAGPDEIAVMQLSKLDHEAIGAYVAQHVDEFDAESLETAVATTAPPALSALDATDIQDYLQESAETL